MKKFPVTLLFLCVVLFCMATMPQGLSGMAATYKQDYISGDVDSDGVLNGKDAVLLLQYLAEWDVTPYKPAADVNCDNLIDGSDLTMLLQDLAEWDITYPTRTEFPTVDSGEYNNQITEYSLSYGGTDALGRKLSTQSDVGGVQKDKYVGIFYFLWLGAHGTGLYDNTEIVNTYSDALTNTARWGSVGSAHFWGKPLFGYYSSNDTWVLRKHVQMLTDADIDFIVFDTTNATGSATSGSITSNGGNNNTYIANALAITRILDEYYKKGWDVPKVAFYTNSNSANAMSVIYKEFYKAHPEYSHLWFNWWTNTTENNKKPLIIGTSSSASSEVSSFFRIKESQWPNTSTKKSDGFPWMEFTYRLLKTSAVYTSSIDGKSMMNVSIAQHCATTEMSAGAWYGSNDRVRSYNTSHTWSYRNKNYTTGIPAVNYGFNFIEQWDYALARDPDIIFITGWNEWTAQRQSSTSNSKICFVDCANIEASRDAEPMSGGYGDNYYMLMMDYIRKFKGTAGNVTADSNVSININGGFGQWDYIHAYYRDYENDTVNRDHTHYQTYVNKTGRNDIVEAKVCNDSDNIYFFVKTASAITTAEGSNWMNLFISTGASKGWKGYNYQLNCKAPAGNLAYLGKLADSDTYSVASTATVSYKVLGDTMMVKIPKSALGISGNSFEIAFKWSDNCETGNIDSFYTDGDAAPIGRMNYVYKVA